MSTSLPRSPHLDPIRRQVRQLLNEHRARSRAAGERIVQHHSRFTGKSIDEVLEADFSLQDAQLVVAREYGHSNWSRLVGVIDLMRHVKERSETGRSVHVLARDNDELSFFESLLRPHYSPDQMGLLRHELPGRTEDVLLSSISMINTSPILISEYRTLGSSHLWEHRHRPEGPFQIDRYLGRTLAIISSSLRGQPPVRHGVKEKETQPEYDEVDELSARQLCELYDSVIEVGI